MNALTSCSPTIANVLLISLSMLMSKSTTSALAYIQHHQHHQYRHQYSRSSRPFPFSSRTRTSTHTSSAMSLHLQPDTSHPYRPPAWAKNVLTKVPEHGRLHLANLPTPIHLVGPSKKKKNAPNGILSRLKELNIKLYVKRDDATGGAELGGNKIRKLEFLLADALATGCDSVVTIGGEQSNHCRATAAASRMVGLSPHLILRTRRADAIHDKKDDIGWMGNIMFDRMVGSTIYTCTPGEYGRLGSNKLVDDVCNYIQKKSSSHGNNNNNNKPYPIPVGGSNAIGTWGYINAVEELMQQVESIRSDDNDSSSSSSDFALDHVVFATGSGGTATGIATGLSLAYGSLGDGHPAVHDQSAPKVHAVGVCDNPEYFYQTMSSIAEDMGIRLPPPTSDDDVSSTEQFLREAVTVQHGKGRGYGVSTEEELDFILQFASETGIVLDHVYSGKALYYFLKKVVLGGDDNDNDPESSFRDKSILFWHTGGSIGLYEKGDDLLGRLAGPSSQVKRIDAYGTKANNGDDAVVV